MIQPHHTCPTCGNRVLLREAGAGERFVCSGCGSDYGIKLAYSRLPRDFVRALSGVRPTFGLGHSAENSRRVANSISKDLCMINGRGGL